MRQKETEKYIEQYYRISNTILRFQNIPLSFHGTTPLRTAPIHLIDMIGKHPQDNLTELAQRLGITKGAVSQMASSLERKGLIMKLKSPENQKNILFQLTDEGKKVYNGHEEYHKELYHRLGSILDQFSDSELKRFQEFMTAIEESMMEYSRQISQ